MEEVTKIFIWAKVYRFSIGIITFRLKCKIHEILISSNGGEKNEYRELNNLSHLNEVELFEEKISWKISKILLDYKQLTNLGRYIANEHKLEEIWFWEWKIFWCHEFAHFFTWFKYEHFFSLDNYICEPFSWERLRNWDMVQIGRRNFDNKDLAYIPIHTMVYLWKWLYISKLGQLNKLIVTDLDEYKKLYPHNSVYILREKNRV